MKTIRIRSTRRAEEGSTLLMAVVPMVILAVGLVACLQLSTSRSAMAFRSQAWNVALGMSEAGVEEAMAHLNYTQGENLARFGWTYSGGTYYKSNYLDVGSYSVRIGTNQSPTVTAQGFAKMPGTMSGSVMAMAGPGASAQKNVRRIVECTTKIVPPILGLISKGKVTLQNNVDADSYDSGDSAYSNNGVYDPSEIKDNTFIGTASPYDDYMLIKDDAEVRGNVGGGAAGVVKVDGKAQVGDLGHVNGSSSGIQSGHERDDVEATFDPVTVPFSSGSPPGTVLGGGDYKVSNFTVGPSTRITVTGNARLHVVDTMYVEGTIEVLPGAHLDLYVGKQMYVQASGKINHTGPPERFNYYGTPGNEKIYLQGSAFVSGVFNAPNATFDMSGTAQLCGAGIFNEIIAHGDSKFHFDEALSNTREGMFQITSWTEK
jgi:hypothetical protein